MPEWIEAAIPVRGHIFMRIEGSDVEFPLADFEQTIPVRIEAPEGEIPATINFKA